MREILELDHGNSSITIDQFQYLRHIYRQMPVGIAITILCSTLVCWLFWSTVPHFLLVPWLTFILLTSGLDMILVHEFNKSKSHIGTSINWSTYNTFICLVISFSWGIGSLLFLPALNDVQQLMFMGILVFYVTVFIPILSAIFSCFSLFLSVISIFVFVGIINLPVENKLILFLSLVGVYLFLTILAAYYNNSLMETFRLATNMKDNFRYLYDLNESTKVDNIQLRKQISEEKKRNDRYKIEKETAEVTLHSIGDGVITTDTEGYITYINPVAELLTGWSIEDASGEYITELFEIINENTREKINDPVRDCLTSQVSATSDDNSILIRRDRDELFIEYSVTPIINRKDIITGTVLVFRDVTDKRNQARDLIWQASHDTLTGLINRREFENRLIKIINSARTLDNQHALCYIDLDQFKIVNDSCGHLAGDSLLEKIAGKLRNITRESDTLARLGGDEFGVILYSCSLEKAKLIAESFRKQVEEIDFTWQDKHFNIGISVGIVPINRNTLDLSEILQLADMACYMAKDAGRNQVHIYNEHDQEVLKRKGEMRWVEEIQNALERENFVLYVQRIKSISSKDDSNICELLLRMKQKDDYDIAATRFLGIAQRYHIMSKLDKWVIKAGFEFLAYGHPILDRADIVSINISGQSIADLRMIDYIIEQTKEYCINTDKVCLEIDESALLNNPLAVEKFIETLQERGFHFALDNFSSSLNLLNKINTLNLDYIKIDGCLSSHQDQRSINSAAIESINKLCHLMGTKTIAKFVSDDIDINLLEGIGVDYIQGYAVAKPTPLAKETD